MLVLAGALSALSAAPPTTQPLSPKKAASEADEFFTHGPIPRLHIQLPPQSMDKLRQNARGYVQGTVRETVVGADTPEVVYSKVGVHLKGGAGSFRGIDDRPGLTLSFGKFEHGRRFHGLGKLHLNNSVQDASYMSENFGNSIFRDAGVPAARVTYARVWINDRDMGVAVLKEAFDNGFLRHFFSDHHGTLYEGSYKDIEGGLPDRVNKAKKNPHKLKSLESACGERDAAARRAKLDEIVDVERFRRFMAMEALTAHWDGYCPNANNYRVYDDPATQKLVFLPHGTDQLFQQSAFELVPTRGMVARALTESPEDRSIYMDRLAELREHVFTPQSLGKRLDEVSARLEPAMRDVGPDAVKRHKEQTEDLRRRVLERVRNVDQQLAAIPRPIKFDSQGVATLAQVRWQPKSDGGNATLDGPEMSGKPTLRIHVNKGECTASYRATVLLAKGSYLFEGSCKTSGVTAPAGQNTGAGLRISGGRRDVRAVGDSEWQESQFPFEVVEPSKEVVLVCELKAGAGEALFDPATLKIRRR